MKKPRLFLHVGSHKTGTTALQDFAHTNRPALAQRGLIYPEYNAFIKTASTGHHEFAHAFSNAPRNLTHDNALKLAEEWLKEAETAELPMLLSAEAMYRHADPEVDPSWEQQRMRYLATVANALEGFEVIPVLCLRRQDDFARSIYQEHAMKMGHMASFDFRDARESCRENLLCYESGLRMFEETFGRVHLLIYEDLCSSGNLLQSFFKELGVDVNGLETSGIVRKSLSIAQTRVMQFLNPICKYGPEPRKFYKKIVEWVTGDVVTEILREYYPQGRFDLWESASVRLEFLDSFEEENARICRKFFPLRDRLFPSFNELEYPEGPELPEAVKALLVLSALREPGLLK